MSGSMARGSKESLTGRRMSDARHEYAVRHPYTFCPPSGQGTKEPPREKTVTKARAAVSSAALAVLMLISSAFMGTPAQAATNPYTPEGVCGSGYTVVSHGAIRSLATNGVFATVYLLKNGGSRCVVTLKSSATAGNTNRVLASILDRNDPSVLKVNSGNFKYYAGPVKVSSSCVHWGGEYDQGDYNIGYYDTYC